MGAHIEAYGIKDYDSCVESLGTEYNFLKIKNKFARIHL